MRYFWFIPGFAVLFVLVRMWIEVIGLPHLAITYTYQTGFTDRFEDRRYLSCSYYGPFMRWTESAVDGWCPWWRWRTRNDVEI